MEAQLGGLGSRNSSTGRRPRQATSLRLPRTPNWRMQEARMDVGLSLEALALATGLARQTVYDTENGVRRPTSKTAERITLAINEAAEQWNARITNPANHVPIRRVTDLFPAPLVATR